MIPVGLSDFPIVRASTIISLKYVVMFANTLAKASTIEARNGEEVAVEVAVKAKTDEEFIKSSSTEIL